MLATVDAMTVRITRARARDLTKLKRLWKAMISDYVDFTDGVWQVREPQDAWQRRLQEYLEWINDGTGIVFVAVDEGEPGQAKEADVSRTIVGYAALHLVPSGSIIDLGESFADIETLTVLPEYRGRGIGHRLMLACRRELERREITYCTLATLAGNAQARTLCEREGFRPFMTRHVMKLEQETD